MTQPTVDINEAYRAALSAVKNGKPTHAARAVVFVYEENEKLKAALAEKQAMPETNIEEYHRWLMDVRCVETPCQECNASGVKAYGNTSTWKGGVGGSKVTPDVCDHCWGSGDKNKKWPSHRILYRPSSAER